MEISAAIYIPGILSLVLSVLLQEGAATGQEPIRIFYGASNEREIFNATTINVTNTDSPRLLRLKFVADSSQVIGMGKNTSNLTASFHNVLTPNTAPLNDTHLLEVTGSGSIIVYGVSRRTHNTDYKYILYFDVQNDPTEVPTTISSSTTTGESVTSSTTTTKERETPPPTANTGSSTGKAQIESSTFATVLAVVVVIILIIYIVTVAALVIYYKNKLKVSKQSKQQQDGAAHDTSITPIAPV